MALITKTTVSLEISDGTITNFKSGNINSTQTNFTHSFGADILMDTGVVDQEISLQSVTRAHQVFIWSDQPVTVKLVPYGKTLADVNGFQLIAKAPSILSVQNIIQIAVTNDSGQAARVVVEGAGVNA